MIEIQAMIITVRSQRAIHLIATAKYGKRYSILTSEDRLSYSSIIPSRPWLTFNTLHMRLPAFDIFSSVENPAKKRFNNTANHRGRRHVKTRKRKKKRCWAGEEKQNKRTLKITAKEGARKPTHVTGETLVILHQLLKFLINFENFADSVSSDLDLLIDWQID